MKSIFEPTTMMVEMHLDIQGRQTQWNSYVGMCDGWGILVQSKICTKWCNYISPKWCFCKKQDYVNPEFWRLVRSSIFIVRLVWVVWERVGVSGLSLMWKENFIVSLHSYKYKEQCLLLFSYKKLYISLVYFYSSLNSLLKSFLILDWCGS